MCKEGDRREIYYFINAHIKYTAIKQERLQCGYIGL